MDDGRENGRREREEGARAKKPFCSLSADNIHLARRAAAAVAMLTLSSLLRLEEEEEEESLHASVHALCPKITANKWYRIIL